MRARKQSVYALHVHNVSRSMQCAFTTKTRKITNRTRRALQFPEIQLLGKKILKYVDKQGKFRT